MSSELIKALCELIKALCEFTKEIPFELTEKLTELYKEPKEERNEGTLYSYCGSEGDAHLLGQLQLQNTWDLEDYTVSLYIGSDNYEVITNLQYESKVIDEPQTNRIN